MAELQAFAPGIYPRSEELVQATRDLDRGRTTPEAVEEQVERDGAACVTAQRDAGLDLLADGMLRWQDHFRPLLGLPTGSRRARSRGSSTRTPSIARRRRASATPKLGAPLEERYLSPLPGPGSSRCRRPSRSAKGTGVTPRAMAEGVLKPQLDAPRRQSSSSSRSRSSRARSPPVPSTTFRKRSRRSAAAQGSRSGSPSAMPGRCWSRGVADLPVEGIGVDFYATHPEPTCRRASPKLLLAGVVDVRSSLLEEPLRARGLRAAPR